MGLSGAIFGVDPQQYQQEQAIKLGYRNQKIADTMAASNNLHKSIALLLDPDTMQPLPGKEQQVAQLRTQLGQLEGYIKNLYNPKFDPETGAITESPLHKLGDKLHITKPPAQPYTDYTGAPQSNPGQVTTPVNKTAGQQLSDLQNIVSQNKDVAPLTEEAAKRQQLQVNIDNVRGLLKKYGATDETIQDVTEGMLGGAKPSAEKPPKYFSQLATTTDKEGKTHAYRVPMQGGSPAEEVRFPEDQTFTPKTSNRPKTQYDQQKEEFAKSIGKTVDQLTWPEEQEFIKKRNPFGSARLGIAYELMHVAQANQQLKENENNFKSFMTLQKELTPLQKIQTSASNADEYKNNPSGPGDVALVFAFIEATKPSSGFRFTETERKWILGSRGIVDGAMTRIQQGFTGETLAPDQREQIVKIIKSAGSQVQQQSNKLLQGAAQFNPKAAAAASTEINGKKKVSLKRAMALPQNTGKSEADVRKDIESHGYEVIQ